MTIGSSTSFRMPRRFGCLRPASGMTSYHLNTLSNAILKSFSSQWIVFCNAADPLIQIARGFWSGGYFHGLEAVFSSYLPIEFFPADAWPFFTGTNTFFDGLLFFFCPQQFRI